MRTNTSLEVLTKGVPVNSGRCIATKTICSECLSNISLRTDTISNFSIILICLVVIRAVSLTDYVQISVSWKDGLSNA